MLLVVFAGLVVVRVLVGIVRDVRMGGIASVASVMVVIVLGVIVVSVRVSVGLCGRVVVGFLLVGFHLVDL